MGSGEAAFHYVCTRDEAAGLITGRERLWVCECACREKRGPCARSRSDVCLVFAPQAAPRPASLRELAPLEAEALLREAAEHHLVARPFRDEATRTFAEGICFCCDDCCAYFLRPHDEPCDRGSLIEETDPEVCTACGACVSVCYFGARALHEGRLALARDHCYGCGLCLDVCPQASIRMVPRGA